MEIRTADWKNEKHVPIIEVDDVRYGEPITVKVSVGEAIPHPNEPGHHISWIELYYIPKEGNTAFMVGRAEFSAHGETGLRSEPHVTLRVIVPGPGKLVAISYCNLHGLWMGERELE